MPRLEANHARRVVGYYRKPESRLSYRVLLGGTKHYGYYPAGSSGLSMAAAMRLTRISWAPPWTYRRGRGSWMRAAAKGTWGSAWGPGSAWRSTGSTCSRSTSQRARRKAARLRLTGSLQFHRREYADLPFADQTFDGVSIVETLVHAFDHQRALRELRRVLKPGGKLVLFEYSVPPREQMTPAQRDAFDFVVERSAMRSLPLFVHGRFPVILDQAGFEAVTVQDITQRMWPMVRRLARICYLPAQAGRLLGVGGGEHA